MSFQPVAAAAPLTPLLTGPPVAGSVVAVFRSAALFTVGGAEAGRPAQIVALLSRQAGGSPNGIRIPVSSLQRPFEDLHVGQPVRCGAHLVEVGSHRYRLVRTWQTAVSAIGTHPDVVNLLAELAVDAPLGVSQESIMRLSTALTDDDSPGIDLPSAVRGLVGFGQGLTPGGDDVLAGLMIGLRATGQILRSQRVQRAMGTDLADRTTALSAQLLRLAAAGHACLEVLGLLRAIHAVRLQPRAGQHQAMLQSATTALLDIGHTSGADLLAGLLIAMRSGRHCTTADLTVDLAAGHRGGLNRRRVAL